ncbi:hypothetical protein [Lactobacillus helveticus]|uniref:hypothetical protein n=1 Tax=Lactobacillus helveticus TaxID=1587 RepID=UPI001FAEE9EB|nr:hypothetical protein [Lactobacillus helveticus]
MRKIYLHKRFDSFTFWHFTPIKKRYFININSQKKYLKKQLAQKTKLGLRIGELLYQKGLTIDDLPDEVFTTWRNPGELDSITKFLQK